MNKNNLYDIKSEQNIVVFNTLRVLGIKVIPDTVNMIRRVYDTGLIRGTCEASSTIPNSPFIDAIQGALDIIIKLHNKDVEAYKTLPTLSKPSERRGVGSELLSI